MQLLLTPGISVTVYLPRTYVAITDGTLTELMTTYHLHIKPCSLSHR